MINNLREPSQLPDRSSYNIFKAGIAPKWEDKQISNGGEWRLQLSNRTEMMDELWLNTLLIMIGEGFEVDASEDIAGIRFLARGRGDRLSIWTKTAQEKLARSIGQHWRDAVLGTKPIEFIPFSDQKDGGGSVRGRGRSRGTNRRKPQNISIR